jgi:hypothetical protein
MLDDKLIGARKVRERYNDVSEMSLWRWLHDDKLAFPHPIYINGRRFWKVSQLEAWERARAAAA